MLTNPEIDRRMLLERALRERTRMAQADLKAGRTKTTAEVFEQARQRLMMRLDGRLALAPPTSSPPASS